MSRLKRHQMNTKNAQAKLKTKVFKIRTSMNFDLNCFPQSVFILNALLKIEKSCGINGDPNFHKNTWDFD